MASLNFDVTALDRASQAFNRIADRIDFLVARLAALNGASASPTVDVDTDPADRTLGRWAIDVRRRMREALATIPTDIELRPNAGPLETTLGRIRAEIAALGNERIGIDVTGAEAMAQIEGLRRELEDLDHTGADVEVKADIAAAIAALEAVMAAARNVDGTEVEVRVRADTKGIKDIINAAALFQRSIAQFSKPIGIIGSIPGIVSLIGDLEDLLGLLGLLPGLAFAGAAAVAALMVGTQGFGDALKNMGDPKKFAESLKDLAPSAQAAAKALQGLAPAWAKIQDSVQQKLFSGMALEIRNLATVLPTLGAGLGSVASGINEIVFQWAKWATSVGATQQLGAIFENIRATFMNLGPVVSNVAQALTDMALVGARMLPDFANGLADLSGKFRDWIGEITANGQFEAWIRRALDVLGQLGTIAGDAFTGLQALFDAADASGAGFLDTLEKMTGAFKEFATSAQGQEGITAFFTTIRDVINGLVPGLAAVGAAVLETFSQLGPSLGQAAQAISGVLQSFASAAPILGAVAATLLGPLSAAITGITGLLGPLPGFVLAAFVGFKVAPIILGGVATAMSFLAAAADGLGVRLLALGTVAGIGGTMTALGTAVGGVATAFRAVATFLTGPFGIAILAAVAVIGLLSSGEDAAAAAADRHAAAVQRLTGSLDQSNGAVTEATKNQVALDLAQTKLATTGDSLATAVGKLGIGFDQFVAASTGSDAALQKTNAQFLALAESQIKSSGALDQSNVSLQKHGVSLDLVTAAALGNVQAHEKIQEILGTSASSVDALVDQYRNQLDPALVEVAQRLGEQSGALAEAQATTQQAADAVANWADRLRETRGVLEEFNGIIGANGQWDAAAAGANQLAESFKTLAETAQAEGRNAAREVTAMGGSIQAAGAAAAASVAQSRAEFLGMADAIGIPKKAAEELADQLGLIPAVAKLNFETNADQTQAQLNEISARLQELPKGTTQLRVEALTDDAIRRLEEIGIKVKDLKDGTFILQLDSGDFMNKLNAAKDAARGLLVPFIAKLGLDTDEADAKLNDFKTRGGTGSVAVPISFEHSVADAQLNDLQTRAQQPMVAPLNVDPAQANAGLQAWQAQAQQPQTAPLNADPAQANAVLGAWIGLVTGSTGTAQLNADPAPANAVLAAVLAAINAAVGTLTIAANNAPALGTLNDTKAAVDRTVGTMTIAANAGPALATAAAAAASISRMTATITVTTTNITRNIKEVGTANAAGGMVQKFGTGGIVSGYAPGRDVVPALLSPGEAVLVPEAVRMLGVRAITGLNKLASGGRRQTTVGSNGMAGYYSWGNPGGRTSPGMMSQQSAGKTYVLNVYNAGNNEIDLREQFRKMQVLGG